LRQALQAVSLYLDVYLKEGMGRGALRRRTEDRERRAQVHGVRF